jgi:hypothetical protein
MKSRAPLLLTTCAGMFIGMMFHAPAAHAQFDTSELVAIFTELVTVAGDVVSETSSITGSLTSVQNSLNTQLDDGFTQISNYIKGQTGAQEQIADANNNVEAVQRKQYLDAQIMTNHVATPQACDSLTNGQSAVAAAQQSNNITGAIETITDARGEADPGDPSYNGVAQGTQAINFLHYSRYCSANDAAANLCTATSVPDADQQASSLLGSATYADTNAVNYANDYTTNLIQPVAPAALRGNELSSLEGQTQIVWRRHYNAQMSLARNVVTEVLASHTPSVELTTDQEQELQAEGLPAATTASWLESMQLDVDRRASNVSYQAGLQYMPEKSLLIELVTELAESNYLAFQNFKQSQTISLLDASLLSDQAQSQLPTQEAVPIPNLASN